MLIVGMVHAISDKGRDAALVGIEMLAMAWNFFCGGA